MCEVIKLLYRFNRGFLVVFSATRNFLFNYLSLDDQEKMVWENNEIKEAIAKNCRHRFKTICTKCGAYKKKKENKTKFI